MQDAGLVISSPAAGHDPAAAREQVSAARRLILPPNPLTMQEAVLPGSTVRKALSMQTCLRPLAVGALLALLAWPALPAAPQAAQGAPGAPGASSLRTSVFNTKREVFGDLWGSGHWLAFIVDEDERDLNRDGDTEDSVIAVLDLRNMQVQETGLAVDTAAIDESDDRLVAFHPQGAWIAFPVSEADQGGRDLNGNGTATDHVLALYNPNTKQAVNTGVAGKNPAFLGDRLYFVQSEATAKQDLNGDGDMNDEVLCAYDVNARKWESLGMEASTGFQVAGNWIAALTQEAAQGGRDLNGDGDIQDTVVQLYNVSEKKWTNTRLDGSADMVLTEKLVAIGVDEEAQGKKDLNGDGDAEDIVCHVWDLATGQATNLQQDCGEGLYAEGDLVALATTEASQGNKDLNNDGDTEDAVLQVYRLGSEKAVNVARDCTGGVAVHRGKVAFAVSEEDNGKKDLNGDGDAEDFVLMVYDPVKHAVTNTRWAVDGDLVTGDGYLAWKVLEADHGNRDLNRDQDTDDSILFVMDLATGAHTSTGWAAGDSITVSAAGIGFTCFEADQGERDLNGDGDADDEILMVARIAR
jgi:hypothetical protein